MFLNGYPYTDFHELNLDYLTKAMAQLQQAFKDFTASNALIFAEPLLHDLTKSYAKNTIVLDSDGNAYISLKNVPEGVQLNNADYWLMVFNFEEYTEKANKNFTVNYFRDTGRSDRSLSIGDWLVLNDVLYKVTTAIAPDELFEVGVNLVHFTVEQFLKDFIISVNALIVQYKNDIDASELAFTTNLQQQFEQVLAGVTVDSEVINARVGWDGTEYTTLKLSITGQVENANSLIDNTATQLKKSAFKQQIAFDVVEAGIVNADDGNIQNRSSTLWSHTDYVDVKGLKRIFQKQVENTVASPIGGTAFYDKTKTYISGVHMVGSASAYGYKHFYELVVPDNAVYARFTVYQDTVTYGDFELYGNSITFDTTLNGATMSDTESFEMDFKSDLVAGTLSGTGLDNDTDLTTRMRTDSYFPCLGGSYIMPVFETDPAVLRICSISFYEVADYTTARIAQVDLLRTGYVTKVPITARYFRVVMKARSGQTIDISSITSAKMYLAFNSSVLDSWAYYNDAALSQNYFVAGGAPKKAINAKDIGYLTHYQAFCKYNDKFYSTNGHKIAIQNDDLTSVSDNAIETGHGNTMQLGALHPNYAYISGWDDQKIYVVNLDTITLVDTITLPTTGYTSGVVDDLNGIAYILQRDSVPSSSEAFYNFIVYDYINDNIISSKQIAPKMISVQGMDFVNGMIYVANGYGDATMKNGFRQLDVNGSVVAEYVLNEFTTNEPEGIFVDRSDNSIYINFVDHELYRLS